MNNIVESLTTNINNMRNEITNGINNVNTEITNIQSNVTTLQQEIGDVGNRTNAVELQITNNHNL